MKTSTEINSLTKRIGEERAIELVAKVGFDHWDFSLNELCRYDKKLGCVPASNHPLRSAEYLAFARRLRQIGLDNGISCNQSHAPFPVHIPEVRDSLKRAIECTAEAGGRICVIHPDNNKSPEENAEMFFELLPFAKGCGVKIATENMWNWDKEKGHCVFAACQTPKSFNDHLDAVNDEFLVACLDIGHAEMLGSNTSAVELAYALGSRLQALHIQDNDKLHDCHRVPFSLQIDFAPIVKALKEIGYSGDFTMEAGVHYKDYDDEHLEDAARVMVAAAKRLAKMFEEA